MKHLIKRKLKILIGIGLLGVFLVGSMVIYIGVTSARYVSELGSGLDVAAQAEALKSELEKLPSMAKLECLSTAQGLVNLDRLLSTPIRDNFETLKQACFGKEGELI